jgi:prepilin-type N-terminal cleavage/methylation domain-containing protein
LRKVKTSKGFTLIEMAIVLVIVGIVVSIVASVLPSLIRSAKVKKAQAILEKVDYALQGYSLANHRLPCADSGTDGDEDIGVYVGNLPFRTLGLASGTDAWVNDIKYGVYDALTTTTSADFCTTLSGITIYNDPLKIHTTDQATAQITNQAYILVSGGAKDLDEDGADGFFDGLNEGSDLQFDDPTRIEFHGTPTSSQYDDLMRAFSLNELNQKNCSGGTPPGGPPTGAGENTYPNGCTNGIDDDGDGHPDCDDQDCYGIDGCGAGGTDVTITTSSIPSGTIDSDYSVTFQATGGTTPYEWTLTNNGGFSDFFLNTYTGRLSGSLNQCPGTYTIDVQVEDATLPADGGPKTDTKSFDIDVIANLSVARTSGDQTTNILWDSATQEETFKANGGHVGDIDWVLNTGGASGFVVASTGSDTCSIRKNGSTTLGNYTFILRATDQSCPSNTADITLTVQVTASGANAPYTVDLEAEWLLDECSWDGTAGEVKDSGDDALDGTAQNGADTVGSGKICGAGFFDGTDDYVDMGDVLNDVLGTTSNAFSVTAWLRPISFNSAQTNHNTQNCFVAKASDSDNDNLEIGVNTTGTVHLYLDTVGQDEHANLGGAGSIALNTWSFVAVTYDSGVVAVTINGTRYEDTTTWSGGGTLDDATGSEFTIGSSQHIDNYFHGKMDEVRVFSRALSDQEIQDLSTMTHACSGSCYTGTLAEYRMENYPWTGADDEVADSGSGGSRGKAAFQGSGALPTQTSASGGKVCRAGIFTRVDGNNGGYLDLGDPVDGDLDPDTNPWTVSAWIRWDGSTGENIIYNKENLYETRVNGGYVQYAWQPHWSWDGGSAFPVTADTWAYLTTVYDGSEQILYKDGVQVYVRSQTGAIGTNGSKLLIGARGSASPRNFFGGMIDEVKVYNRALAENEIMADMDESRDCSADSVVITTTSLPNGIISSSYSTTIAAAGGTTPYGWQIVGANPVSGLSIVPNTGELTGTINVCAGTYDITVRVTDAASRSDERSLPLTVDNGTLSVAPASPQTFNCDTSTFYQDFSVSGPRVGGLENWAVSWLGTNPGGFEVISTGAATARFRKIGTSSTGSGFQFKLTARDSTCNDNQVDSGYYTLNISGQGADTPYYADLGGEWQMDECTWDGTSNEVLDSSGAGAHGESYNMGASDDVNRSIGKVCYAGAFNLDGTTNQYVSLDHAAFNNLGDFSLCMWFRLETLSSSIQTLFSGARAGADNNMLIYLNATATSLLTWANGVQTGNFAIGGTVNDGLWHHLAWTRQVSDGTEVVYVDGTPLADGNGSTNTANVTLDAGGAIIGQEQDSLGGGFATNQVWHGWIDEVMVYNKVLSQPEVTTLLSVGHSCQGSCYTVPVAAYYMDEDSWNIGVPDEVQDASGNGYHGTPTGDATVNQTDSHLCYGGEFADAPGNDSCITVTGLPVSTTADDKTTVCFWMKWAGTGSEMPIGWSTAYDLYFRGTTQFGFNTGAGDLYGISGADALAGNWHHVGAVFNNNAPLKNQLYIDGVLQPTALLQGTPASKAVDATFYVSGWSPSDGYKYNGLIDELRIYTRGLSASEVAEDINLSHSCPGGP